MRDRLGITITDVHGSKHFSIHQMIKKLALYFALLIVAVILIGGITIQFLLHEVDDIEAKRDQAEKEYQSMIENMETQYHSIEGKNQHLLQEIQLKTDELITISDKVEDLESIIGVKKTDDETSLSLGERVDQASITGAQKQIVMRLVPNGYPIEFKGVTSKYGKRRHPILKRSEFHTGIDLRAEMKTPVYAPADGVVDYARGNHKVGYGNLLTINHSFGFKTLYGHLSKIAVKRGKFVKKGELVAYTGNSGLSNGPHLHYEIRFIGSHLNPNPFMGWTMANYTDIFEKENKVQWQSLLNMINRLTEIQAPLSSRLALK